MDFMSVAMRPQGVALNIGHREIHNLFAGEAGRQPALPELMGAFDFAIGLGRGSIAQVEVIEFEGPAQLSQGVGLVREKARMVIAVELLRAAMLPEGGGQKIKAGKQPFALGELAAGEQGAWRGRSG